MSTKIECHAYLKSKLENEFTKLITGDTQNLLAAQNIQRIVTTAHGLSDGQFVQVEQFYFTSKFMRAVQSLNDGIIGGTASAVDFNEYVAALVTVLQA